MTCNALSRERGALRTRPAKFKNKSFVSKDGFGTDSSIINEGPGRFFLDLNTANAEYTVTTEDCTGTSQDGDITTEPSAPRPPPTPDPPPKRDVIRGTIPKKPLPPTGGLPVYVMVTGSILAGTGLLGLVHDQAAFSARDRCS